MYDIFLCGIGDSPRFHRGVALQHEPLRANADAITEASRSHPTNPLVFITKVVLARLYIKGGILTSV